MFVLQDIASLLRTYTLACTDHIFCNTGYLINKGIFFNLPADILPQEPSLPLPPPLRPLSRWKLLKTISICIVEFHTSRNTHSGWGGGERERERERKRSRDVFSIQDISVGLHHGDSRFQPSQKYRIYFTSLEKHKKLLNRKQSH